MYKDRDWLYGEYIEKQRTIKDIALQLKSSPETISKWLGIHGIKVKSYADLMAERNPKMKYLRDKDWLQEKYCIEFLSLNQLSKMLNVTDGTVKRWINYHGIETRNLQESRIGDNPNNDTINDDETIPKLYASGLNIKEIAEKLDCGFQTVYRRLLKNNVTIENFVDRVLQENPLLAKLRHKEWMLNEYIGKNKSTGDIAGEINTNAATVYFWLKKHGVDIKDSSFSHSKSRYSDEEMELMLKSLGEQIGHIPSVRELNEYCGKGFCPSATTYSLRGGIPYWQKRVFGKRNRAWLEWQKQCLSVFNKALDYPEFKAEKSFDWLRSPITGHKLKVDAYYPKLKLVIEFDGLGHFKPVQFLKGQDADKQFEKTQIHDAAKNKRIPEHGLRLLRFRYDEPLTEEYVSSLIENIMENTA